MAIHINKSDRANFYIFILNLFNTTISYGVRICSESTTISRALISVNAEWALTIEFVKTTKRNKSNPWIRQFAIFLE